jgi:hypothetical protein
MKISPNAKPYYVTGAALLITLVVGGAIYAIANHNKDKNDSQTAATPTPSITTSPTPTAVPSASPSPTASAQPTPSPTPSPSAPSNPAALDSLPGGAQVVVKGFYGAYTASNAAAISPYFADDTSADDKSLRSQLFFGKDANGIPGGPTLFVSGSVLEHPKSYEVTKATRSGTSWNLTISETRLDGNGKALAPSTFVMVLTPKPDTDAFFIASYSHSGSTQKYDGFFTR